MKYEHGELVECSRYEHGCKYYCTRRSTSSRDNCSHSSVSAPASGCRSDKERLDNINGYDVIVPCDGHSDCKYWCTSDHSGCRSHRDVSVVGNDPFNMRMCKIISARVACCRFYKRMLLQQLYLPFVSTVVYASVAFPVCSASIRSTVRSEGLHVSLQNGLDLVPQSYSHSGQQACKLWLCTILLDSCCFCRTLCIQPEFSCVNNIGGPKISISCCSRLAT